MGNDKDVEFFIILYSRIINLQPNPHPNHKIMTTNANQNTESNKVNPNEKAGNESSFEFKGFPYVISILGEDYNDNENQINGCSDDVKQIKEKIKEKIKGYIDKIAEKCTWDIWYWKKSVIPLFILFDANNKFIKEILEEKQKDDNNRKDRDIVLVAVVANKPEIDNANKREIDKNEEEEIDKYKNIFSYNDPKNDSEKSTPELERYYWIDPKFDNQDGAIGQRQLNEFIAQRSHLTIVYSDSDVFSDIKDDINEASDDSLIWSIRYKLEGDPGSQYQQEQNEKITYPAIGPILYIVNDGKKSETFLFPSREPITEEQDNKNEKKTHIRIVKKNHNDFKIDNDKKIISECFEIVDNLRILKDLNMEINKSDYIPKDDNLGIESLSIVPTSVKDTPEEIQSAIKCYHIVHRCAEKFKELTTRSINILSVLLLFVLLCNAILIYLNDICLTSVHTNAIQVTRDYFNKYPVIIKYAVNVETSPIKFFLKDSPSNDNAESGHNTPALNYKDTNVSLLSFNFVFYCLWLYISIISIIYISKRYLSEKPHYQYHRFQTLADCLRVQVFWKYAGMPDEISTNFRAHQIPEIDWLKIVLNGLEIQLHSSNSLVSADVKTLEEKISCLDECWLEDRINNEFKPELQKGIWKRFKDNFGWNKDNFSWKSPIIYLMSLSFVFPLLCVLLLQLFKISLCIFLLFFSNISLLLAAIISLLLAAIIPIIVCGVLIKKYWEQLINFCKKISDMIVNNKGRLLAAFSLLVVIYFCLSGFFELVRLNNLCSSYIVTNKNMVTDISFSNFQENLRLIIQIIVAFVLITFFNIRMHMFDKEKRRIELLLPCFDVADRSIDVIISEEETRKKIASKMYQKNKELISDIFDKIVDKVIYRINEMLKKHDFNENLRELSALSLDEVDISKVIDFDVKIDSINSKNIDFNIEYNNIDNKIINFDSNLNEINKLDIPFNVEDINYKDVKLNINKVIDKSGLAIERIGKDFESEGSRNIVNSLVEYKKEIRDIINDQLGSKGIFSGVISLFSGSNKKIDDLINKLNEKIDAVTLSLKEDAKERVLDIVNDNLKIVKDNIIDVNRNIEIAKENVDKYNKDVMDSINNVNKKINHVRENIKKINIDVNDKINKVNEKIKGVNGKFEEFNEIINDNVKNVNKEVQHHIDDVKKNVKDVVNEKITQVNEDVKKEVDKYIECVKEDVKNSVRNNISNVITKVNNEAKEFNKNLNDKFNNIKNDLDSDINAIKTDKLSKIEPVTEENAKINYLKNILLELGQEVLAKRIDWLLDVNDRNLKSPK